MSCVTGCALPRGLLSRAGTSLCSWRSPWAVNVLLLKGRWETRVFFWIVSGWTSTVFLPFSLSVGFSLFSLITSHNLCNSLPPGSLPWLSQCWGREVHREEWAVAPLPSCLEDFGDCFPSRHHAFTEQRTGWLVCTVRAWKSHIMHRGSEVLHRGKRRWRCWLWESYWWVARLQVVTWCLSHLGYMCPGGPRRIWDTWDPLLLIASSWKSSEWPLQSCQGLWCWGLASEVLLGAVLWQSKTHSQVPVPWRASVCTYLCYCTAGYSRP